MTDDFETNKQEQNDYLWSQIDALRRGPRSRWRRFRLYELVCADCGDALVEVIDLDPYPGRVFAQDGSVRRAKRTREKMAVPEHRETTWWPGLVPNSTNCELTGDDRLAKSSVQSVCRCDEVLLSGQRIHDALIAKDRKQTLRRSTLS